MATTTNTLFHVLLSRYKQFGGLKVVRYYAQMGVLWPMMTAILRNPFSRQSYKKAYAVALQEIEPFLMEKYSTQIPQIAQRIKANTNCSNQTDNSTSRILETFGTSEQVLARELENRPIWFCWLQGLENAPAVVHACYNSIKRNIPDREIKVIDAKNWSEYVELPDYIVRKWEKRQIPPAHFTDLLRLQLLIKYGGTWIDSTVLCTGGSRLMVQGSRLLEANLFMFQYTKPGSDQWGGIGNWFISSCSNNEVLMVLRDMLLAYWKDYDCLLDYYMFHLFFTKLRDVYSHEIAAMPYAYVVPSITLVHHWGEKFDKEKWERFTSKVCFHKLAYSVKKVVLEGEGNYYKYILSEYGD